MKKWSLVLAAALLAGCGNTFLSPKMDVGVQVNDAATSTGTQFVFQSRPGSQEGYITGYRFVPSGSAASVQPGTANKLNVFIQSGWMCPLRRTADTPESAGIKSCDAVISPEPNSGSYPTNPTTYPAPGTPSAPLYLGGSGTAVGAVATFYDFTFTGISGTGQAFSVSADHVAIYSVPSTPTTGTSGTSSTGTSGTSSTGTSGTSSGGTSTGGGSTNP